MLLITAMTMCDFKLKIFSSKTVAMIHLRQVFLSALSRFNPQQLTNSYYFMALIRRRHRIRQKLVSSGFKEC